MELDRIANGHHHAVHAKEIEGSPLLSERSLLPVLEAFSNVNTGSVGGESRGLKTNEGPQ